jgi:hypothetical protein
MSFWSWLTDPTPPGDWNAGDPEGVVIEGETTVEQRAFPGVFPSAWDGWPDGWSTPAWDFGSQFNALVDIAWACIDLNSRVM